MATAAAVVAAAANRSVAPPTHKDFGINDPEDPTLSVVKVDALAVLKIVKHSNESYPDLVNGQLLGLDWQNELEVTNCVPFPRPDEEGESGDYRADMEKLLKMLREVNVDTHAVGWYQSVNQGSLLGVSVIESQLSYQKDMKKCVVLAYDPLRTRQSSLYLKAYRLTPAFIELFSKHPFSKEKFDASAMRSTEIFEEIPVQITNSYLLTGFLSQIQNTKEMAPSFETLGVSSSHYLERTVDLLLQGAENLGQEQGKFQYYHKQVARQNQKKDDAEETTQRQVQAPSRLEGVLAVHTLDEYCTQVANYAGASAAKLFLLSKIHEE